jgi:hypothetical protein
MEARWNAVSISNDLPNYNAFSNADCPVDWMLHMLAMGDRKERQEARGPFLSMVAVMEGKEP